MSELVSKQAKLRCTHQAIRRKHMDSYCTTQLNNKYLVPVFSGVDVGQVERAVTVYDVYISLWRQVGQQLDDVADSAAIYHHHTANVLIALRDSISKKSNKHGQAEQQSFSRTWSLEKFKSYHPEIVHFPFVKGFVFTTERRWKKAPSTSILLLSKHPALDTSAYLRDCGIERCRVAVTLVTLCGKSR